MVVNGCGDGCVEVGWPGCVFNPRLTELFFVTPLTRGVVATSSLDFTNRTPYEIDFGING